MSNGSPLRLFEGFGIEIEYMIVDAGTLDVLPACDEVLRAVAGEYVSEVRRGGLEWSNELVLHVIELRTASPVSRLAGLERLFQDQVLEIEQLLVPFGGTLLPAAMHPWMDPETETQLWPHEYNRIYQQFDRIFSCRGHGWSNLQSTHINLPFRGDEEFGRLHAAVRLVLPLLPGLAASSPVVDGALTGMLDTRLAVYRNNATAVPSVSGELIPEPAFSRADYEAVILQRMYRDIAPLDPDGVLQHEWLNARGAIARFDRSAIEIRLIDVQECPLADLAIAALVIASVKALVEERWLPQARQRAFSAAQLDEVLRATTRDGERAVVEDGRILEGFGLPRSALTAGEVWQHLAETALPELEPGVSAWDEALSTILQRGTLARRLSEALGPAPGRDRIVEVYRELSGCLQSGTVFR